MHTNMIKQEGSQIIMRQKTKISVEERMRAETENFLGTAGKAP